VAFEISDRAEAVLVHEGAQLIAHLADAAIADFHHVGADLHRVAAEQYELRRVAAAFDAADARERSTRKLGFDELGYFHTHPQGDWQDRLA